MDDTRVQSLVLHSAQRALVELRALIHEFLHQPVAMGDNRTLARRMDSTAAELQLAIADLVSRVPAVTVTTVTAPATMSQGVWGHGRGARAKQAAKPWPGF
jgi:hypothetical protein